MSSKPTCGPLYLEAMTKHTGGDAALIRAFAAGHINGQAEKVYLGACKAAMFRPSADRREMACELASDAADRYGLRWTVIGDEIWMAREPSMGDVLEIHNAAENSPEWHHLRGLLCGVPIREIDVCFHERRGYGQPCDLPERSAS